MTGDIFHGKRPDPARIAELLLARALGDPEQPDDITDWQRAYYDKCRDLDLLRAHIRSLTAAPWRAGDPCGSCGSTDTGEGLPHEGAFCRACGRSDDDD